MLNSSEYDLVRMGYDCDSAEERLPTDEESKSFLYVYDCAKACDEQIGCNYFKIVLVFSNGLGRCVWKKTDSADCTEGWKWSEYNFFEIISMLD